MVVFADEVCPNPLYMEEFIERSNALLRARPETARVTTTYTHKNVPESGDKVDAKSKATKVVVKAFDTRSGIVYKYKVRRFNELSRILASLGPQQFDFAESKKRGIASYMSGVEPAEHAEPVDGAEKPKKKKK